MTTSEVKSVHEEASAAYTVEDIIEYAGAAIALLTGQDSPADSVIIRSNLARVIHQHVEQQREVAGYYEVQAYKKAVAEGADLSQWN